ncbi:hypothetical protein BV22DRAFT_1057367, partial [Leucogyrophana mollusca]
MGQRCRVPSQEVSCAAALLSRSDTRPPSLRRQHLRLLLVEPYAKESKDIETHLWMQT